QLIQVPSATPSSATSSAIAARMPIAAALIRTTPRMRSPAVISDAPTRRSRNSRSAIPHPPNAAKQIAALATRYQPAGRQVNAMTATISPIAASSAKRASEAFRARAHRNSTRLTSDGCCDSSISLACAPRLLALLEEEDVAEGEARRLDAPEPEAVKAVDETAQRRGRDHRIGFRELPRDAPREHQPVPPEGLDEPMDVRLPRDERAAIALLPVLDAGRRFLHVGLLATERALQPAHPDGFERAHVRLTDGEPPARLEHAREFRHGAPDFGDVH